MRHRFPPMLLVAVFSGATSLVYQVTWDRTLRFNFGGDTISSAIVTASFLLGLGIGALAFGRWRANPVRTLAFLEIGIGTFALASYPYLTSLARALGTILQSTANDAGGLRVAVIAGCILFIVPPSVLMGGTLPVLFNWFVPAGGYSGRQIGLVYGLNTLGAAAGILVAPFVFLNHISIPTTLWVVGSGNIVFGGALLLVSRRHGVATFRSTSTSNDAADRDGAAVADNAADSDSTALPTHDVGPWSSVAHVAALSFASGFMVLAFEMSVLRNSFVLRPSNPYNFPAVLMPFLLGMAAGSICLTRFRRDTRRAALRRAGILFAGAAVAMLVAVWAGAFSAEHRLLNRPGRYLVPYLVALVVPYAFLAGGVFPLLLKLAAPIGKVLPRRTGVIYMANSLGSFSGALATQFLGFPMIGTRGVISVLFFLGTGVGLSALLSAARLPDGNATIEKWWAKPLRKPWVWPTAAALLLIPLLLPASIWSRYTFGEHTPGFDAVEGSSGVATIDWDEDGLQGEVRVNGMYMSALPDHPIHVTVAGFALSLPRRTRVLLLGVGGGGMVRELIADAEVVQVDVVDWSRELLPVLDSPRARRHLGDTFARADVGLILADARVAVELIDDRSYDIIIDNLAAGGWVGSTNIKSVAFYAEIKRILRDDGVFVYNANYSSRVQRRANLAAVLTAFTHVREHPQWIVLASNRELPLERERVEHVFASRPELGISPPYSEWVLDELLTIRPEDFAGVEPIRDELPIHEYTVHPLQALLGWVR